MDKRRTENDESGHLTEDELDWIAFVWRPAAALPAHLERHLATCEACRAAGSELRTLQAAFGRLPSFAPSSGFSDRVLARVSLPRPLRERSAEWVRARWRSLAAAGVALGGSSGAMAIWLFRQPQVTPQGLIAFLVMRVRDFGWQAGLWISRVLVESGLAGVAARMYDALTVADAIASLATLGVMTLATSIVLVRLLHTAEPRLLPTAR